MNSYSLESVKERELFPGFVGKFIHSDNMTFVYWDIAADSPLPAHSHPHEQVINMFEGQFEIRLTGGETRVLGPGEVYVIPGGLSIRVRRLRGAGYWMCFSRCGRSMCGRIENWAVGRKGIVGRRLRYRFAMPSFLEGPRRTATATPLSAEDTEGRGELQRQLQLLFVHEGPRKDTKGHEERQRQHLCPRRTGRRAAEN